MNEPINVKNAGLVLLNPYVPMLFERLGITIENEFVDKESQLEAVHYLQYLVTGQSETEDFSLSLNKLMCGLPLSASVKSGITISDENKNLMNEVLRVVIERWSFMQNTKIAGLSESFLIRDGVLEETENYWEIIVEKHSFDMLLDQLPCSFSIIQYPWMNKTLQVNWL